MKNIRIWLALVLAALALCAFAAAEETDPAAAYEAAMALYEAENFEQAIPAFEALGDYKDSRKMLANSKWYWKEQRYDAAVALYKAESYAEAQALFEELGSFEESRKYASKCAAAILEQAYVQAESLFESGRYQEALTAYEQLGKYKNSVSRMEEIQAIFARQKQAAYEQECYENALALKAEGRLAEARDLLIESGHAGEGEDLLYEILETLAKDEVYARAAADRERGQFADAIVRFETLNGYQDSAERAQEARAALTRQRFQEAASSEDPNRAMILYLALDGYEDSAERADALKGETDIIGLFKASEALRREGRAAEAAIGYALCENYKDSNALARQMEKEAENSAQFERAHILTELWQLEEANAIYQALGRYSYASRMGIERISTLQLRDDATTPMSAVFTAPDGTRHTYRIFKGVHRWVEAKSFCQALGGHLATMTTPEENAFVHQFMMDNGFKTAYFGLEDEERDQTWEWVTGEPVEYLNWDSGEPSYSPRERYGMYFYKHIQGTWNDAHFYEDAEVDPGCSFICEWDLTDEKE